MDGSWVLSSRGFRSAARAKVGGHQWPPRKQILPEEIRGDAPPTDPSNPSLEANTAGHSKVGEDHSRSGDAEPSRRSPSFQLLGEIPRAFAHAVPQRKLLSSLRKNG